MDDRTRLYSRQKHRLAIFSMVFGPVVLFLFMASGLTVIIKEVSLITAYEYINLIIFTLITSLIYYTLMLPIHYYSGFMLEHKFSLSNQTLKDWIKREIKEGVVSFAVGAPIVLALYLFLKFRPFDWWLWSAILWFLASIILTKFAPILIVPIFYKYSPIKNDELKQRLIQLVSNHGFNTDDVYEINISKDTKKANAALMGLGKQKRIVLCDTLMQNFTNEEIESVMAHELGHHKLKHTLKLITASGASTIVSFLFTNLIFLRLHNTFGYEHFYDYESLVLIYFIMSVLNLFILPISNAFTRKLEKDADVFALKAAENPNAFISMMQKLAHQNLSDVDPGKFYEIILYNHPPISRRIALAESFKAAGKT